MAKPSPYPGAGPFARWTLLLVSVSLTTSGSIAGADQTPRVPRVRAEHPDLAAAIARGIEQSKTFRGLVDAIEATDGLVYVLEGTCGQGLRACLHMSVELAGPYRLLRVLVNRRRAPGCELVGSIGHELQHALEALSNPNIRNGFALSSYFHQIGPEGPRRFETPEAEAAGVAVATEACRRRSQGLLQRQRLEWFDRRAATGPIQLRWSKPVTVLALAGGV